MNSHNLHLSADCTLGTSGNFKYFPACTVTIQFTTLSHCTKPLCSVKESAGTTQEGKLAQQHKAKESNSALQGGVGIGQETG